MPAATATPPSSSSCSIAECAPDRYDVQSGIHWAAYGADDEIVGRLLQHGWPVNVRHLRLDATPLELALAVWAHSSDREDPERGYAVVARLVRAGAALDPAWFKGDERWRRIAEQLQSDARMQETLRGETGA